MLTLKFDSSQFVLKTIYILKTHSFLCLKVFQRFTQNEVVTNIFHFGKGVKSVLLLDLHSSLSFTQVRNGNNFAFSGFATTKPRTLPLFPFGRTLIGHGISSLNNLDQSFSRRFRQNLATKSHRAAFQLSLSTAPQAMSA